MRRSLFVLGCLIAMVNAGGSSVFGQHVSLLTDQQCWDRMPEAVSGTDQPLPSWARAIAVHLPRTAASMLKLDHAHRTLSPLDPQFRAKLRWIVADRNQCDYSRRYAIADLRRAGASPETIDRLTASPQRWPDSEREALDFVSRLTTDAPSIPDEQFASLRAQHGDRQVAAMVLLAAYGNFQDRIVLGLGLPMEDQGPLPPLDVHFAEGALQVNAVLPDSNPVPELLRDGDDVVLEDADWSSISFEELQSRLDSQRAREPRLPIPTWDEVKLKLPTTMSFRPTRIRWNLICYGYAAELAVPWTTTTRTMWSEMPGDRVFEESLFWVQTRAVQCNYCMGHCEMLLEVAGLDRAAVAERTRHLASNDWSVFPPAEQRAYAYARKLSKSPWLLTADDYRALEQDLGEETTMSTFWWLCRGLYMTRISDGFQLPLERENVFDHRPTTK